MRLSRLLLIGLTATALSACSKKENNTKDKDGNCTAAYRMDHNNLARAVRSMKGSCNPSGTTTPYRSGSRYNYSGYGYTAPASFSAERCETDLRDVVRQCDTYQASHKPGRTCNALDEDSRTEMTADTTATHDVCNKLRNLMASADAEKAKKPSAPEPARKTVELKEPEPSTLPYPADFFKTTITAKLPDCEEAKKSEPTRIAAKLKVKAEMDRLKQQIEVLNNEAEELRWKIRTGKVPKQDEDRRTAELRAKYLGVLRDTTTASRLDLCLDSKS